MRILIVEDEELAAEVMKRNLVGISERCGPKATCETVADIGSANEALALAGWDVVVLDLKLATSDAADTLQWLSARAEELPPVVVVSGIAADQPFRAASFRAGADDFLSKAEVCDDWSAFFRRIYHAHLRRHHSPIYARERAA